MVAGKGTNKKTTLYVGGLEETVNEAILHSAFIPFGDIKDVNIPMDNTTGKHRGFGFVEYENAEVSINVWAVHLLHAVRRSCHASYTFVPPQYVRAHNLSQTCCHAHPHMGMTLKAQRSSRSSWSKSSGHVCRTLQTP